MLFFTWKYIDDATAKGGLASDSCIKAFEECWDEYVQDERKIAPPPTPDAKEGEHA